MGLMALLEKTLNEQDATATLATPATVKPKMPPCVATVATVAVASSTKLINEPFATVATVAGVAVATPQKLKPALQEVEYTNRLQYFQAKGISSHDAQALADRLAKRDKDWIDDRRSCAECLHYYAGKCGQGITLIGKTTLFSLVRCKGFQLEGARND